jgi:hypothetical protein
MGFGPSADSGPGVTPGPGLSVLARAFGFGRDGVWDLAAAWVLLPPGGAPRFFDGYAQADEATVRRARGLAAMKSLFLMLFDVARSDRRPSFPGRSHGSFWFRS